MDAIETENGNRAQNVEEELQEFREKWQKELKLTPTTPPSSSVPENEALAQTSNDETVAEQLFFQGIEMEKSGKLYEAIRFYKKAIQLVPDIERKIHETTKTKENIINNNSATSKQRRVNVEVKAKSDLLARLRKKGVRTVCTRKVDQTATHFSGLPVEIVLYILRWVVSAELDLKSLETFGHTCRGFYLLARDEDIWRSACAKIWGNVDRPPDAYGSWRATFLNSPRPSFDGCYIGKTTYIRAGENSFQDEFYRPWHLVAYYRYFRFFPDGIVLTVTSPDEPTHTVGLLKHRHAKRPICSGFYRLINDKISVIVCRKEGTTKRDKRKDPNEIVERVFQMEFLIVDHRGRKNCQLQWTHYSVNSRSRRGEENTCVFDLVNNKFPPLWFSKVKSYNVVSEEPLI